MHPYPDWASKFENQIQESILKGLGSQEITDMLATVSSDDRIRLFVNLRDKLIKDAVNLLPEEECKTALTLIGYNRNSIGLIMTPHYIQAKKHLTNL